MLNVESSILNLSAGRQVLILACPSGDCLYFWRCDGQLNILADSIVFSLTHALSKYYTR